ncbi:hypothetical protein HOP50_10g59760 [Chloropicon primus]|nr:hypothetical protein HOP50_10g59760 [Chloropicon primus]
MTRTDKEEYAAKCEEFKCEPLLSVMQQIDEAALRGEVVSSLNLRGISKTKLNEKVTNVKLRAVAEAFTRELKHLDVSYNFVDDSSCQPLIKLLETSTSLKELDLGGNDLCVHGSLLLAQALSDKDKPPVLEALSLQGNPLGDEGGYAISDSMRKNVNLRELNLNDTGIGISSLINVADALTSDNRTIEVIEIGNPKLSTLEGEHVLYVARMLACNPKIRALNLKKHPLRDTSFTVLLECGLMRNKTLETLCLSCCQITSTSAPNIEKLLSQNTSLRHLDLSNNPLTDEVALGIARGLGEDKSLEMINLQNCRLTNKGLLALASAAEGAETLAHIKLWGNHFGQESGAAWAKVLEAKGMKSDFTTYVVDGTVHVAAC